MLKVGTTFSGIGAPEQALKNLKIPHVNMWACDIDANAKSTYLANHECSTFYDDIRTIDTSNLKYVDLYVFGFPCQDCSVNGKQDLSIGRTALVQYSLDIIDKIKPKYIIFENVKNLLSTKFSVFFNGVLDNLRVNYQIDYKVLNSVDFGVPQNRERVFLVGQRKDCAKDFLWPNGFTQSLLIKDILEEKNESFLPEGHKFYKTPFRDTKNYRQYDRNGKAEGQQNDRIYKPEGICGTLMAQQCGRPMVIIDEKIRKLSLLERKRLQGFPDNFIFPHKRDIFGYNQLGNSMTVNVIQAILGNLLGNN